MEKIRPLIWDGEALLLLDQRALPEKELYIRCSSAEEVGDSIRDMVVRGAPAIGVAAAFAMVLAARHFALTPSEDKNAPSYWPSIIERLVQAGETLKGIRPTAVNLSWGVEQMLKRAKILSGMTSGEGLAQLEKAAREIYKDDIAVNKRIGEYGASLLPASCSILTHCNAGALATAGYGTALGVIRSAFTAGKDIRVFADETRPFLQGSRLTAWELQQEGIPVTLSLTVRQVIL
jgi:methylthioribose-1-phosphate isomerase